MPRSGPMARKEGWNGIRNFRKRAKTLRNRSHLPRTEATPVAKSTARNPAETPSVCRDLKRSRNLNCAFVRLLPGNFFPVEFSDGRFSSNRQRYLRHVTNFPYQHSEPVIHPASYIAILQIDFVLDKLHRQPIHSAHDGKVLAQKRKYYLVTGQSDARPTRTSERSCRLRGLVYRLLRFRQINARHGA